MSAPLPAAKRATQAACAAIADPLERTPALADLIDAINQEALRMKTPAHVRLNALAAALASAAYAECADADAALQLLIGACGTARVHLAALQIERSARLTPPSVALRLTTLKGKS